jgi:Tfp pilus assembly protein PilV
MNKQIDRVRKKKSGEGFSLMETMVALGVMTIAMLGGLAMVSVGIQRNSSLRTDTTATNVAQTVLEEIASLKPNANPAAPPTISDCATNLPINTAVGGAPVWGPAPGVPGVNPGDIDFTQAVVPGYQANYLMCAPGGFQITYDVRWRIDAVAAAGGTNWGKLVTVAARQPLTVRNGAGAYSPPVTLRTVVGM